MSKEKTINNYVELFNEIVNKKKFSENDSASDLSESVLYYIKKEYSEIQEYTQNQFYLEENGIIKHPLCDIEYTIRFYFKISTKRSTKTISVLRTKNKYLNYIGESPIKFNNYEIRYHQPVYKLTNKKIEIKKGWTTNLDVEPINISTKETVENIVNKVAKTVNNVNTTQKIKKNIIMDIVERALLNNDFYKEIHFENFLIDGVHFDIEKIYQFAKDNEYF